VPLEYTIVDSNVKIISNETIKLLTGSEQLNLEEIKEPTNPIYNADAKTLIKGTPYQYVKVLCIDQPELTVLKQTHENN
jgi:hypothetical protein